MSEPTTPLAGKRVLVTRPAHQASGQIHLLQSLGAEAVALPVLAITPYDEGTPEQRLAQSRVLDLDLYQSVIFVSANAANLGAELIDQYWPQLPIRVHWLAIGQRTASVLADYGIDAESSTLGYDSEALLKAPCLQQIEGERILIMRGSGGRETLAETLQARGAQVDYADLYQRGCPRYPDETIDRSLYRQRPDALLITSGEGLTNLQHLARGSRNQFRADALLHCQLVVPSERVAELARQAGFKRITTAPGPDDQAMVRALLSATDAEIDR